MNALTTMIASVALAKACSAVTESRVIEFGMTDDA